MLQVRAVLLFFSKPLGSLGVQWVRLLCLKLFTMETPDAPSYFRVEVRVHLPLLCDVPSLVSHTIVADIEDLTPICFCLTLSTCLYSFWVSSVKMGVQDTPTGRIWFLCPAP